MKRLNFIFYYRTGNCFFNSEKNYLLNFLFFEQDTCDIINMIKKTQVEIWFYGKGVQ